MKIWIAAAALAALAACQSPCPTAAPQRSEVTYACADGARVRVNFDRAAGRALVSEDNGAPYDLHVQVSGQGFRYAGEGAALAGRGQTAEWTSPAGQTVQCTLVAEQAMARSSPGAAGMCDR